jgi:enamine deaminase RidA (YjgF/YER057c/UK114 family)
MSADQRFQQQAAALGYSFDGPIKVGGNYAPVVRDGALVYVSGQIPRVGDQVVVVGAAGAEVPIERARLAAKISTMRALALVGRAVGGLSNIVAVPRMTVFVRSAPSFTQQSEVADSASDLLAMVLGPISVHSRTSVGVLQLPKGATVEVDFIFKVNESLDV